MNILDLSGLWRWETDENDVGIQQEYYKRTLTGQNFKLPGSTCENGIGKKQEYYDEYSKEAVRTAREKYEHIGPLWLQRDFTVPKEFEDKTIRLFLERVNIASDLWLDGVKIDRQIIELSAPHIYVLTGKLTSGIHTITLRIDNRNLLNCGKMASGYSMDTQGYWNGIIGRIELQCENKMHIENVQIYTEDGGIRVRYTAAGDDKKGFGTRSIVTELTVIDPNGEMLKTYKYDSVTFNSRQPESVFYPIAAPMFWSEFNPAVYTLKIKMHSDDGTDEKYVKFGMRTIKTKDGKIILNGKRIALRGTINCAQYPITGYPPTDIEIWKKQFKIIKSYGLNHIRFHAWCPPESAFSAADELGVYLQIEMPLWINVDNENETMIEYGDDSIHQRYFLQEAVTISKTYGNHPSFIMFSNGNETKGNMELLSDITVMTKALDPRRIYAVTSNFDHPPMKCEDFYSAADTYEKPIRIQNLHDDAAKNTCLDFSEAVEKLPVPVVSFEVGQYCVYPDVDIADKYMGNMTAVNFDAIRKHMKNKGVYHRLHEYIAASGNMAVKLYKEDIEAALRTKMFGGFQLLSLSDYTGQSTATIGILDVFLESKGLIEKEAWRGFCGCVVPLFKAKRIFENTEILEAELDLYDYGENPIAKPKFDVKIYNGNEVFYETTTADTKISVPLDFVKQSSVLKVDVTVNEYTNSWNIYVFVKKDTIGEICIIESLPELEKTINNGGKAMVTATALRNSVEGSYIPAFWSPVYFDDNRQCGAIINNNHSIFKEFPTDKYPDYQWKTLMDNSKSMVISELGNIEPIFENVPNFDDNTPSSPLFEARVGNADILFCGFDLNNNDITVQALKQCITEYVSSDEFKPKSVLDKAEFMKYFK